ncbi:hypothetical protein DSM112329_02214 [Paraconexibacter sp. AEG42_29]|uniref:TIGR04222 domain-containing membrane protein n=2 Tax=Paraconexibacter sp. AEG42_29 TaxID=2997339 RepID=A0AAU7AUN9_9ACTN
MLLVLRDRTRASSKEVLLLAVGDLIDLGLWRVEQRRRRLRRTTALVATGDPVPGDLPDPLAFVQDLLTKAAADAGTTDDLDSLARWFGRHARRAGSVTATRALEQLVTDGLLARDPKLRVTTAGEAVLRDVPPGAPKPVLVAAGSKRRREDPVEPLRFAGGSAAGTVWAGAVGAGMAAVWVSGYDNGVSGSDGGGWGFGGGDGSGGDGGDGGGGDGGGGCGGGGGGCGGGGN